VRLAAALLAAAVAAQALAREAPGEVRVEALPPEARATLALIRRGGPFPYPKDGTVFANREGRLPKRPHGYYREYTVKTPGIADRGPRRIVAGHGPGGALSAAELYYTEDHYRSFRRILE
jgi:guanyl-specific ribonuclease Sa